MPIVSEDPIFDDAKQTPLNAVRDEIVVLFNNQIGDQAAIVSDTIQDGTGEEVDAYLRQLVLEQELPINKTRFTRKEFLINLWQKEIDRKKKKTNPLEIPEIIRASQLTSRNRATSIQGNLAIVKTHQKR